MQVLGTFDLGDTPAVTAHRVDRHVYIGGYLAARDAQWARREGIGSVVKLFADDDVDRRLRLPGVVYTVVAADDVPSYDMRGAVMTAMRAIDAARARDEKVLVHCHMGISRSATIVLMYLMLRKHMTLAEAYAYLKSVRDVIRPNEGFMRLLATTDRQLKEKRRRGQAPTATRR